MGDDRPKGPARGRRGRPMVRWVVNAARASRTSTRIILVVGHGPLMTWSAQHSRTTDIDVAFVTPGRAVGNRACRRMSAEEALIRTSRIRWRHAYVLAGDGPLIQHGSTLAPDCIDTFIEDTQRSSNPGNFRSSTIQQVTDGSFEMPRDDFEINHRASRMQLMNNSMHSPKSIQAMHVFDSAGTLLLT